MKGFCIGQVRIDHPFMLAPMAGVGDLPFRVLCKEQGASLVCMEMVSAKALEYHNRNTLELLRIDPDENPVSLQLFGSDPEVISAQAAAIEELPFDILDLNMGCPVPKVAGNGEGSALMKDPVLAGKIIEMTVKRIRKPVTVKIRKGFDAAHVNAVEIAKIAQESGASAVAVHGRTRDQFYSGKADWEIIRKVKEALSIPVIGNGDVTNPEQAEEMLLQTGCDGVMIGRGARGNPWIFERILTYMETGKDPGRPDAETIRDMILRHARFQIEYNGEMMGIRQMRKHVAWYTAGLKFSARIRDEVNRAETYEQLEKLVSSLTKDTL